MTETTIVVGDAQKYIIGFPNIKGLRLGLYLGFCYTWGVLRHTTQLGLEPFMLLESWDSSGQNQKMVGYLQ